MVKVMGRVGVGLSTLRLSSVAEWWPQWQQFMFQATAWPPDPDMIHAFTVTYHDKRCSLIGTRWYTSGCQFRGFSHGSHFCSCQEELELKTGKNGSTKRTTRGERQLPCYPKKVIATLNSTAEVDKTIRIASRF